MRRWLALAMLVAGPAHAERIGVAVAGEPSKRAAVVEALADALRERGHSADGAAFPAGVTQKLAECFVAGDEACARSIVSAAAVRTLFVMVEVDALPNGADAVSLSGWSLGPDGTTTKTERRVCSPCKLSTMPGTVAQLADALLLDKSLEGRVRVTTTPSGATVYVDETPIGSAPIEYALVAGSHRVGAEWGTLRSDRPVDVRIGEVTDVDFVRPEAARNVGKISPLTWGLIGIGGGLLGGGAALFFMDEDAPSPGRPQSSHYSDTAALGLGVAAAGAGVFGYGMYRLVSERKAGGKPDAAPVSAWLSAHSGGIVVAGTF